MNDFTKEDLLMIKRSIHETIVKNDPWENPCLLSMHRALKEKIKFMIDNYCEHEFREYPLGVTAIPFCNKCKKVVL